VALPRPEIPDLPAIPPALVPGVDPTFTIDSDIPATVPLSVSVPINVDDALNLHGFNLDIAYDTTKLNLSNGDVSLGDLFDAQGGWTIVANVDDATGLAKLAIYRSAPIAAAGGGEVVELEFDVEPGSFNGTPLDLDGPAALGGLSFTYDDGSLDIGAIPGDVDLDGDVDADDYSIVSANYGMTGAVLTDGDASGDGIVNLTDISIVSLNFGATAADSVDQPDDAPAQSSGGEPATDPAATDTTEAGTDTDGLSIDRTDLSDSEGGSTDLRDVRDTPQPDSQPQQEPAEAPSTTQQQQQEQTQQQQQQDAQTQQTQQQTGRVRPAPQVSRQRSARQQAAFAPATVNLIRTVSRDTSDSASPTGSAWSWLYDYNRRVGSTAIGSATRTADATADDNGTASILTLASGSSDRVTASSR
jgi:hypothetical protein